jgi:hypothetical protein
MAVFCCPKCSHTHEAPDEYIGRTAKCSICETRGEITKSKPKSPPSVPSTVVPALAPVVPAAQQSEKGEQRSSSFSGVNDIRIMMMSIIGILVCLLLCQLSGVTSTQPGSTSWEYVIDSPGDEVLEERLESLGKAGWELVSARRATDKYSASYEMIFKRPK